MNSAVIDTEAVLAAIDAGFNRMPIRNEGVHWLKALEWDAIKAELTFLRDYSCRYTAVLARVQDLHATLETIVSQTSTARSPAAQNAYATARSALAKREG